MQLAFLYYLPMRGFFLLLVAGFSASLPLAAVPPELPSTPAGQVLAGYLEALNSGKKDTLEAFIKAHRPDRPDALDRMLDLRWNTGGFDLYAIESSQALNIQAVLREREGNERYNRMSVSVSGGNPPMITNIGLVVIPPPAGARVAERLSQEAALAAWETEIDKATATGKFSGVWLWTKGGKVLTSGARGKADREKGIDNTLDTKFRIGSMNKMFTAVATLQLVERGKLSLDDTIGKILTDYPNTNVASKVKVRHLLSHTGGTGDIFGPGFDAHRLELKILQDYVKLYGERDLLFEPGTKWEYSNYGFLLLGVLIEKVSGKSYYDFVAENIYQVAGMTNSGSEPESVAVANRSKGYYRDRFEMVANEPTLPWRGTSAGGGYTTAADLMKFADALMANKLLKAETLAEVTRSQFTTGDYGFGFQVGRPGEVRTYGHGGGAPGMNGILRVYPESGQSVIVLCNLDPPSASRLGDWLHVRMPLQSANSAEVNAPRGGLAMPSGWTRRGVVLERQRSDSGVSGDPCIVWDDAIQGWRMVLFYDPPGHAQAVCTNRDDLGPGQWKLEGPLPVANPKVVGGFHKPFIVMDPEHPNQAAKINGRYCLLVVSFKDGHKHIQRAWSEKLAGPWTFEPQAIIPVGAESDFDARHTDAVTGYYFAERKEFLYFYMGYPRTAQSRKISPFGSAQAVATQKLDEQVATKRGVILEPCQQVGHWASGWVGGLQLLRGALHRWVAVVNASPTAPDPGNKAVWTEEPPPSLSGFAWCDEEWPVKGWHFAPEPIEWVKDIPQAARDAGEGYNLWRQFIHILPDGRAALFYNSGYYGREQLYLKVGDRP